MNTPLDAYKSGPEYTLEFTGKTKDDGIKLINQFIGGVNKGKITIEGYTQFPFENDTKLEKQFPFYFRPTKNNIDKLSSTAATEYNMVNDFFKKVKLLPSDRQFGSALVWAQNVIGQQLVKETLTLKQIVYNQKPVTYGTMAGDFLYLLSHKTDIPLTPQFKEIIPSATFSCKRVKSKLKINLEYPMGLAIPPSP